MTSSEGHVIDLPLRGASVVQLCELSNVAIAGWTLAQLGCVVVAVKDPNRETQQSAGPWAGALRSIEIDVATSNGLAHLLALIDGSVVLIDATWEMRLDDAGVSLANLERRARGVVRVADEIDFVEGALSDSAMTALTGLSAFQTTRPGEPSLYQFPVLGTFTGLLAAVAAAAQIGEGAADARKQSITVSRSSVAALLTGLVGTTVKRIRPGSAAVKIREPRGLNPAYRVYETKDGWVCVTCTNPDFYARFCIALGLEALLADPRFEHAPWAVPHRHHHVLVDAFGPAIARLNTAECMALFESFDVPAQPVQTLDEYLASDLVEDNEFVAQDSGRPALRFPGSLDGRPLGVARSQSSVEGPGVGAVERSALDGIVVADFSSYLAGPVCTTLLADLGASVIKVEPIAGEGLRSSGLSCLGINRNKKGIAVDLRSEGGAEVARRLTSMADIVVTGFRPGVSARLGLDHAALTKSDPRTISISIDGYGSNARLATRPSFDPLLQALGGQMDLQGREVGHPVFFAISLNDFVAGFLAATGALALMHRRCRTGAGGELTITQAGAAMLLLGDEVAGNSDSRAGSTVYEIIQCSDDTWVHIEGDEDEVRDWLDVARAATSGTVLRSTSEELLANAPAGIRVTRVGAAFPDDPDNPVFEGKAWRYSHPYFGEACSAGKVLRRESSAPLEPGPYLGEHSAEVLRLLDFDESTIGRFFQDGVVASPVPDW